MSALEAENQALKERMDALEEPVTTDEEVENDGDKEKSEPASKKVKISDLYSKNLRPYKKMFKGSAWNKKLHVDPDEPSEVVYIGSLPQDFEEEELRKFLDQFGNVKAVRVSRSRKTGKSRGYAYVAMQNPEVAEIVADTLSGYFLMGETRLVSSVLPNSKVYDTMFFDFIKRKVPQFKQTKPMYKMKAITNRLLENEKKRKEKLKALGIDYDFPGFSASATIDVDGASEDIAKFEEAKNALWKKEKNINEDKTSKPKSLDPKESKKGSEKGVSEKSSKKDKKKRGEEKDEKEEDPKQPDSHSKKKKRKDSTASLEEEKAATPAKSETKSIDKEIAAEVNVDTSSGKKKKQKNSSATDEKDKYSSAIIEQTPKSSMKHKDSIASVGSAHSAGSSGKKKRSDSDMTEKSTNMSAKSEEELTDTKEKDKEATKAKRQPQSEKKADKKKKSKSRRKSS